MGIATTTKAAITVGLTVGAMYGEPLGNAELGHGLAKFEPTIGGAPTADVFKDHKFEGFAFGMALLLPETLPAKIAWSAFIYAGARRVDYGRALRAQELKDGKDRD